MDMKKILQAMDSVASKPVEGSDSMKRFLQVVNEAETNKPTTVTHSLNEGANPHKVALPVQMAMSHYQQPTPVIKSKPSLLKQYFVEAEEEINTQLVQDEALKRQRINMYAKKIANRVLMKESTQSVVEAPIDMTGDPNDPTVYGHEKANPMSLKGRIMSARAQLKELADMADSDDLVAWEKITQLHKGGMFMGLAQNLEQIRHGIEQLAAKRKQGGIASRGIDKNIGEVYDGEPDEYHVLRHQTKDDIEKEMPPKSWTRIKEFDGYQAAKKAYDEMKLKHPNQKFTVTTHSKERREEQRKQWGLEEAKDPCWKDYKQIGMKKKGGKQVPNCVPKK